MKITNHARKRAKQRIGLGAKGFARFAKKAEREGTKHNQLEGKILKFVNHAYLCKKTASNFIVYRKFLFIMRGDILITVIILPDNLIKEG